MKRPPLYFLLLSITWLMVVLSALPPFVSNSGSLFIFEIFDKFCHQLPGRSLHIEGHALAVCARCTAIYFGLAFGLTALMISNKKVDVGRKHIVGVILILLLQWTLELIFPSTAWLSFRIITGLMFGLLGASLLSVALQKNQESQKLALTTNPAIL